MKKVVSRKKRAIRWMMVAAITIVLFNLQFQIGYIFPHQTLRRIEQSYGCGKTEILFGSTEQTTRQMVYLSANEHAMIFTDPKLAWHGWYDQTGKVTDCSDSKTLRCGFEVLTRANRWDEERYEGQRVPVGYLRVPYAYGRVDDPNIAEVQITYRVRWHSNANVSRITELVTCTASTYEEDWKEQDGSRYFLLRIEPQDKENMTAVYDAVDMTGLDSEGNTVVKYVFG